jgi:hypothetical protein
MLPLGYLGPRNEWHESGQTTFTPNEQVSIMTLWSMLPSPLMFGGNPARLADDEWTLALLTNEEMLAVNQDVLGAHGKSRAVDDGEIWTRDLSNGRKAVAFFNRGDQDATMSATLEEIGVSGELSIRDVWRRSDASADGDVLTASVPGGAALLFTLSDPASGGMGGTGGADGMGGMGGTAGSGAVETTGAAGTSSGTDSAGAQGSGDGSSVATSGDATTTTVNNASTSSSTTAGAGGVSGSVSTGAVSSGGAPMATVGTSGVAGSGALPSPSPGDDDGCACAVPGRPSQRTGLLLVVASFVIGLLRWRRVYRY